MVAYTTVFVYMKFLWYQHIKSLYSYAGDQICLVSPPLMDTYFASNLLLIDQYFSHKGLDILHMLSMSVFKFLEV